jgi:hypothetical protein
MYSRVSDPNERGVMPHYKCDACRIRLHPPGNRVDRGSDLCPECGSVLDPIADLAQLVGFRLIASQPGADPAAASTDWPDPDDVKAAAIALPPPETYT